LRDKI